jgi:hypothetical protein
VSFGTALISFVKARQATFGDFATKVAKIWPISSSGTTYDVEGI